MVSLQREIKISMDAMSISPFSFSWNNENATVLLVFILARVDEGSAVQDRTMDGIVVK